MNIYLLKQDSVRGWDTYDSAVVWAETEEEAKRIHPNSWETLSEKEEVSYYSWPSKPEAITAVFLGLADDPKAKPGVICASFNAG